jgi:hypothetical protein
MSHEVDAQRAAIIGTGGCRRYYDYYRAAIRDRKRKYGRHDYYLRGWIASAWFFRQQQRKG